jgi:hypothetical protein
MLRFYDRIIFDFIFDCRTRVAGRLVARRLKHQRRFLPRNTYLR